MMGLIDRKAAFELKTMTYVDALFRTAAWMLDDRDEADKLVRLTYAKAYLFWDKFHTIANCQMYLFKTMISIFTRDFQGRPESHAWTEPGEVVGGDPWSQAADQEANLEQAEAPFPKVAAADARKMLMDLPNDLKLVIVLSWLEGFSYREIGFIVGIRLEEVKSKLYQARQFIHKEIYKHAMAESNLVAVR